MRWQSVHQRRLSIIRFIVFIHFHEMKILLIHNDYQQPGGERAVVYAQRTLLETRGHTLVSYMRNNQEIENFGFWEKLAFFPQTIYAPRSVRDVRALVAQEKPQIAHIHNVFPLISPSIYSGLHQAGVPIVQTVHNFRFLCPNGLLYTHGKICERCKHGNTLHAVRYRCFRNNFLLSGLYAVSIGLHRRLGTFNKVNRFIALTEFTAQKLLESGFVHRNKISVLGNFLPTSPTEYADLPKLESPYYVYIGRLSLEKGVTYLLQAMAGLSNIRLKILGGGPELPGLQAFARDLGLTNVDFMGFVEGEHKYTIWRNALATIVPSVWYENFPVTILESMALKLPVVASNLGSIPYNIEDGRTGVLFQPANVDDLREKLNSLTSDENKLKIMGENGFQKYAAEFSADAHYKQLMRIYQDVLDEAGLSLPMA